MFKNINNLLILLILIASLIICYIFYNVFILEQFDIHCDKNSGLYNHTVCTHNKYFNLISDVVDLFSTRRRRRRRRR